MKSKLCCVFNCPSLYREAIYKRIDEKYDCVWIFEDKDHNLATFDTRQLTTVSYLRTFQIGPFYWVNNLLSLLFCSKYDQFLMMGHSRNMSTMLFLFVKRLFYPNKKVFLWTHGFYGKESKLECSWKKLLYQLADGLFLYGQYARNLALSYDLPKEKLWVIRNSLDYQKQLVIRDKISKSDIYKNHFQNEDPVLIYIGRLLPNKRLDMIIESVFELYHQGTLCNLVLIGDGQETDCLKKMVRDRNLESRVWFYGASYDEETNATLIYNASICIAPGNVGLTAIHSMMFGCPVITHDYFPLQMPEFEAITQGITGDFYHYGDQKSLSQVISSWISKKNVDRERVRMECFQTVDNEWNPDYQLSVLQEVIPTDK